MAFIIEYTLNGSVELDKDMIVDVLNRYIDDNIEEYINIPEDAQLEDYKVRVF